jgi:hypothetical protein
VLLVQTIANHLSLGCKTGLPYVTSSSTASSAAAPAAAPRFQVRDNEAAVAAAAVVVAAAAAVATLALAAVLVMLLHAQPTSDAQRVHTNSSNSNHTADSCRQCCSQLILRSDMGSNFGSKLKGCVYVGASCWA